MAYVTYNSDGSVRNVSGGAATSAETKAAVASVAKSGGSSSSGSSSSSTTSYGIDGKTGLPVGPGNDPKTVSPTVITSDAANTHKNTVVQPALDQAKASIQAQSQAIANQKVTDTQQKATDTSASLDNATKEAKLKEIQSKIDLIKGEMGQNNQQQADTGAAGGTPAPQGGTTSTGTDSAPDTSAAPNSTPLTDEEAQYKKANDEYYAKADEVSKTILNIQNGVVPLTDGEKAQVQGLQQQYQTLIDQQGLINTGAAGSASIRGYQTGAGEYDPTFNVKTIGNIVSAGATKIADLNTKMAAATADLEQSFKDNKISAIQKSYSIFKDASDARRTALKDTISDTQKAIKDAQDAQAKVTDSINEVAQDLAKNGAPASVINAATSATSVSDAIAAGAGYFQDPTSLGGQYNAYVNATLAKGLTPMAPGDFISKQKATDAYNSAYGAAKGKAAGENAGGGGQSGYNGDFAATIAAAARTGTTNQKSAEIKTDLQNAIANGDYKSAYTGILGATSNFLQGTNKGKFQDQVQSQSVLADLKNAFQAYSDAGGKTDIFKGNEDEIGKRIGQLTTDPKYSALATQLDTAFQIYRQQMTGAAFGAKESAEYAKVLPGKGKSLDLNLATIDGANAYLNSAIEGSIKSAVGQGGVEVKKYAEGGQTKPPKDMVDDYVKSNPGAAETVAKLYEVPGVSEQDVLDYINLNKPK